MTEPRDADLKIDGIVAGNVIQANVINANTITITGPAAHVLDQLQQAQQQLLLGRRAEQRTGLLTTHSRSVLHRSSPLPRRNLTTRRGWPSCGPSSSTPRSATRGTWRIDKAVRGT
ncbi:hypothetical protein [Kibdelosporangium phytohabitans]|uniref:hypothetical protein n=1 Tax=Kibdelosporangium phytohabitans TaxID=860235 RepID=UPI0012F9E370|nr:hypothetical protein [Kibdelosporangium phytohabitans]MBE1464273.1 hypothetical protein [Kibdelosporangium phytohabitans]